MIIPFAFQDASALCIGPYVALHFKCTPRVRPRTPSRILKSFRYISKSSGLTLLEVLIALVILAIALTALIKSTAENIRATTHLQEKTIATWVGLRALSKARLDLIQFPESPDHLDANEVMLNQSWEWEGFKKQSPNAHIHEIHIKVFHRVGHRFITELTGYSYAG